MSSLWSSRTNINCNAFRRRNQLLEYCGLAGYFATNFYTHSGLSLMNVFVFGESSIYVLKDRNSIRICRQFCTANSRRGLYFYLWMISANWWISRLSFSFTIFTPILQILNSSAPSRVGCNNIIICNEPIEIATDTLQRE